MIKKFIFALMFYASLASGQTIIGPFLAEAVDTTALKKTPARMVGAQIHLSGSSGGWFISKDSTAAIKAGWGVFSYPSATVGRWWLRSEWIETGILNSKWVGSNLQKLMDVAKDNSIIKVTGDFTFGANDTSQVIIRGKDNLFIDFTGSLIKLQLGITLSSNRTRMLDFIDCDNLSIVGLTGYGDVARTMAADNNSNFLNIRTGTQDSVRNVTLENVDIRNWHSDAIWFLKVQGFDASNILVDSCAEGFVMHNSSDGVVRSPKVGRMLEQDGIETSYSRNIFIDNVIPYRGGKPGPNNTTVDFYYSQDITLSNSNLKGIDHPLQIYGSKSIKIGPNDSFTGTLATEIFGTAANDTLISIFQSTFEDSVGADSVGTERYALYMLKYNNLNPVKWSVQNCLFRAAHGILINGDAKGITIEGSTFQPWIAGQAGWGIQLLNYGSTPPNGAVIKNNNFEALQNGVYLNSSSIDTGIIIRNTFPGTDSKIANPYGLVETQTRIVEFPDSSSGTAIAGTGDSVVVNRVGLTTSAQIQLSYVGAAAPTVRERFQAYTNKFTIFADSSRTVSFFITKK